MSEIVENQEVKIEKVTKKDIKKNQSDEIVDSIMKKILEIK